MRTDILDVAVHMIVSISDVGDIDIAPLELYRPTKGADRVCHRSSGLSLTVSRPGIDCVVKCRRNPDTVSALHSDQSVGPPMGTDGRELKIAE